MWGYQCTGGGLSFLNTLYWVFNVFMSAPTCFVIVSKVFMTSALVIIIYFSFNYMLIICHVIMQSKWHRNYCILWQFNLYGDLIIAICKRFKKREINNIYKIIINNFLLEIVCQSQKFSFNGQVGSFCRFCKIYYSLQLFCTYGVMPLYEVKIFFMCSY